MPGLGPRVGGAHVDVNLQFDDRSVATVGKRIHRQLSKLSNQLAQIGERNRQIYQSIGRDAVVSWRALLGTVLSSAPLIGSAISGVAGAATLLAGAFYSTVQASYGFAPLLAAIGIAAGTAAIGMNGFMDAVKSGDMSELTPSAAAAARAIRSLDGAWQRLRDTVQENMFKGLADDIERLGSTLFPVLTRGLGKMATALNGVAQSLLDYVNSRAGLKQINDLLNNSADIFERFGKAIVPALDGLLKLLNALAPAGKRLADRIAEVALNFQEWASAPGFAQRIDDMMKRAEKTAGLLLDVLGNLGGAIASIFNTTNPATNKFLEMLIDVTQRFEDWTKSAEGKNSIAQWAMDSIEVMRQFGKTIEAVFKVLAELADPRVIISFLKTLEGAFNYLGKLPLDKMVDAFVKIAEALQPISSLLLAIIIAGAAFNIFIGVLVGQLGGLFSVIGKIAAPLAGLFKPLASAGKHGKTLTGIAAAFGRIAKVVGPVLGILVRFAKFIPFVGWAIWIGTIIAKSKDLQEKLGNLWDAVKDFGKSFVDAFKEIGEALKPLLPALEGVGKAIGWVFDILDKVGEFAIGIVIENLIGLFKGLADVVRGAGKIIAGVINVIVGLFTGDMDKVTKGLGQLLDGVKKLIEGVLKILFTGPANATKAGMELIGKWWDSIKEKFPEVLAGIGSFLLNVVNFFATLPAKLLALGLQAIQAVGTAVVQAAPGVLAKVGNLVSKVITWIAKLPGRLLALGTQALARLAQAVISGTPKILQAASKIFNGVANWIAKLPGKLLQLGQQAITKLAGAVQAGISRLRGIAANILSATVSALSSLPGKLLNLGQQAISKLAGAVQAGVGRLRGIAASIASAIVGAVKGLPGEMLNIGKNIIGSLVSGLTSQLGKLKDLAGEIGGLIKGALPGSPVEHGPLTAWNRGSGATGGGRNVIDAITAGLKDTSPIKKAMTSIADAVSSSMAPTAGVGLAGVGGTTVTNSRSLAVTINNPQAETGSDSLTRTTRNLAYLGLA